MYKEFKDVKEALMYASLNNKRVFRQYRMKIDNKTGIEYREYYYKIVEKEE